ncbi:MAG: hypothetical protein Q9M13_10155 [Mariprofundales bacterium]|nr:hypothetical protein [Mariprofundales bacterium]
MKEVYAEDPVVYVTQEQPHINYAQAEQFGDIVFCSLDDVPPVHGSLRTGRVTAAMASKMEGYRAGVDYILPSGSPLNIAAVMMLAGRRGDRHNILKWESRAKQYSRVLLEVPSGV